MKKLGYFFAILAVMLLVLSPGFVFAFEVIYPALPGIGTPSPNSLTRYVQYVFTFAFMVAGIIGVISIVVAGFQKLLYAGAPEKAKEANERIFNAILGIVILMTSFILLRTINPSLLNPMAGALPIQPGVYLVGPNTVVGCSETNTNGGCKDDAHPDGYIYMGAGKSMPNVQEINSQYDRLFYYCPPATNGPSIMIWVYNKLNYQIDGGANGSLNVNTYRIACGKTSVIDPTATFFFRDPANPILSFRWDYRNAGILYYMTDDCTGIASKYAEGFPAQTVSGDIPWFDNPATNPNLDQAVRSIAIVNSPNQNYNYGFILNDSAGQIGECSLPIIRSGSANPISDFTCISSSNGSWPKDSQGFPFGYGANFETGEQNDSGPWSVHIIKQARNPGRDKGISFWSNNLALQYTIENDEPSLSIGNYKLIEGDLAQKLKEFGESWRSWFQEIPVPEDECTESDVTTSPSVEITNADGDVIATVPNESYKGYQSCINKAEFDGNFNLILYTKSERADGSLIKIGCQVFNKTTDPPFYDPTMGNSLQSIPSLFSNDRSIYQTVIIPTVP